MIVLGAMVSGALVLNFWNPSGEDVSNESKNAAPKTQQELIRHVRDTYNKLGRAGEDLQRRADEARAQSAEAEVNKAKTAADPEPKPSQ